MSKDYGLDGKVALVTGAGQGMGKAIAEAYAEQGARVVLADIKEETGRAVTDSIRRSGGEATFVPCDVTQAAAHDNLIAETIAAYGRLDCACNNAGMDREATLFAEVSDEMAEQVLAVNFHGVFLGMKRQIKQMIAQGSGGTIVNLTSISAQRPHITGSVYSGAKAGVVAMTKGAAMTYAKDGVRINMVAPGAIDTPMLTESIRAAKLDRDMLCEAMSVNGRFGDVREIAEAVLWLSSGLSTFTYGHVLAVDGGFLSR